MEIPKEKLLEMYEKVLLARKLDNKQYEMNAQGLLPGLPHLGAGQEAMPVAIGAILRKNDYLKASHRGFHCGVAKGIPVKYLMATVMGRIPDATEPVNPIWAPGYGLLGMSGTLGEEIPIYVGAALSCQLEGKDRVTACFFGEGTSSRGPVHESMNLAAVWKLPIVFICENNQYAVSTPADKQFAVTDVADRGAGYGMPGVVVDGNDVIACYEVAYDAVKRAREGVGPSFIESKTYRLRGHMEGDQQLYRSKEEVEEAGKKEPVGRMTGALLKAGILTQAEVDKFDADTTAEIEQAVEYAQNLPIPDVEEALSKLRR